MASEHDPAVARGTNALVAAAAQGDLATAYRLLEQGADVHATDDEGRTVLELAEAKGRSEIAALLREHSGRNP